MRLQRLGRPRRVAKASRRGKLLGHSLWSSPWYLRRLAQYQRPLLEPVTTLKSKTIIAATKNSQRNEPQFTAKPTSQRTRSTTNRNQSIDNNFDSSSQTALIADSSALMQSPESHLRVFLRADGVIPLRHHKANETITPSPP
jgi:hypothetical protein